MINNKLCNLTKKPCIPEWACLEFRSKGACKRQLTVEYGRHCSCHPATIREITPSGEGLPIAGEECSHRKWIMDSWQSMCSPEDRAKRGCI